MSDLAAERCRTHADREAAARCPECRRHFCRECVTEHEGRMVCAGCISRLLEPPAKEVQGRLSGPLRTAATRGLRLAGGLLVAWISFYLFGQLLTLWGDPAHEVPAASRAAQSAAAARPEPAAAP
jgi:hypothetical protein